MDGGYERTKNEWLQRQLDQGTRGGPDEENYALDFGTAQIN